jgi:hypothetical protein
MVDTHMTSQNCCRPCLAVSTQMLLLRPSRLYNIPANTSTTGTKVVSVEVQPQGTPADSAAAASYRALITCGAPFGLLDDRPDCPVGRPLYTGPDGTELESSEDYATECCVSDVARVG